MRYLRGSFAALGLLLIAGCQQAGSTETAAPQPASVVETIEATAIVQTIDLETRQVLLKVEDGRMLTIVADPEVRNLEQVEPGDKVKAVYIQGVAAQMAAPGQAAEGTEVTTGVALAAEGAKPAAVVGNSVRGVVTIVSYYVPSNLVTFASPDGLVHSAVVRKPEMQEFARGLKPGDEVEVTFTEAVAVGIVEIDE
jgi:Cu/Ag efflux protein CusF